METTITMTAREQRRARVLTRILRGLLTMAEGSVELRVSERQLWRLRAAFVAAGPAGLVHGNRGRPSPQRIDPDRRARIVELRERYGPLNDTRFDELLAEREGISISRESLRAILRSEGIASPRRRRSPRYRSRRPRMGAEGTLLQLDGSRHRWLEARGPELVLVGAIDDATGLVTAAVFRDQEDAAGYLEILSATIEAYGLPGAIYRDGHSAFAPSSPGRHRLLDDDDPALSQVGRALVELDIDSILAGSPQAKGRIERLWGTFQDRLVVELRLAGVVDRASANAFLVEFLARHNARFVVPAADPVPAWRALPDDVRLERVLVFKYRRKVRQGPHRLARRPDPAAAPRRDRCRELCRQAGRGPCRPRRLDRRLRRRAPAGRPRGPGRSGPAAHAETRARPAEPQPRGRYDPLDTTPRSSLEAANSREQARETTVRIARQLS
jgi:transposase